MTRATTSRSQVEILTPAACTQLLSTEQIGRVGFQAGDGPWVLPVNYVFWNGAVAFRTTEDGTLSQLASRSRVAFEIDHVDPAGEATSVVVRGFSREVLHQQPLLALLRDPRLVPWAPGPRTLVITIEPESISGLRIPAPV